VATVVL